MKRTKRLLVALMTALLALPLFCSTALADSSYTFVVKQTVEEGKRGQYEYKIYQMLTGDLQASGDNYVISNAEWGSAVTGKDDTISKMYQLAGLTAEASQTPQNFADYLASRGDSVFHTILNALNTSNGSSMNDGDTLTYSTAWTSSSVEGYGKSGLAPGYYLVRNTKVPEGETYSDYIVRVVGKDTVANPKSGDVPTAEKKVNDVNDSTGATSGAQDSADYEIGDVIPFSISFTLPSNYKSYNKYRLIFLDDLSKGLTLNEDSLTLYINGVKQNEDIDTLPGKKQVISDQNTAINVLDSNNQQVKKEDGTDLTVTVSPAYGGGKLLTYYIADLTKLTPTGTQLDDKSVIRLDYTATLNSDAEVGLTGNANSFRAQYTNSPTVTDSIGTTPEDKNTIFTYQTVFNKVDESNKALSGATFKLEKWIKSDGTDGGTWKDVTALNTGTNASNPTYSKAASAAQGTEGQSGYVAPVAESVHTFKGLDDGKYRLTETTTPTGYNTMSPIEFSISATHDITSEDPRLTALTGTDGASFNLTSDVSTGTLSTDIVNKAGATLPTTGGAGTTALYVVGGLLLGGSVVALIVKRRMRA